jgi:tetratricopeptide (TPR) repeat protein
MDSVPPEALPDMDPHDRTGDFITLALVVATLFGAGTVWLQAHAVFAHDEAAVRAEEWTVLASAQRGRVNLAEQLDRGRAWQARRDRIGSAKSTARRLFGRGNPVLVALEARQWKRRAHRVERESRRLARANAAELDEIEERAKASFPDIHPARGRSASCAKEPPGAGLNASAGRDPPTLSGFAAASWREAYRTEGLRSGAAQTAVRAEEQFTRYAGSLAAIAVALFLFGYALTRYGHRYRKLIALLAAVLTAASVVWTVITLFDPPEKPRAAAAAAYADGRVALREGDTETAVRDLACATRLNPDFAEAFLQRSIAVERDTPGNLTVVNESLEGPRALRQALEYGRRSHQIDSEYPQAVNQIATSLYVFGLRQEDRSRLARALRLDREMAATLPNDPIPAFNAGTTLLALGKPWRRTYRQAESLMRESAEPLAYAGGALTDLDYLGASGIRRGIRAATEAAKEHVVASVSELASKSSGRHAGDGEEPSLSRVGFSVSPASAELGFAARGFDPTRDRLFAAWYRHRPRGWQELPQLSGLVSSPLQTGGGYWTQSWSSSCLRGGAYRVEFYVNGRLAKADPAPRFAVHLPRSRYRFLRNMNLGVCYPRKGWHRIRRRAAGLVDGLERRVAAGREGVVAFDVSASPAQGAAQMDATVLRHFTPPLPDGVQGVGTPSGSLPVGPWTAATTRVYPYRGGSLVLATAVTPIGRKLAVAVFGPPALFAPPSRSAPSVGRSILASIFVYDGPDSGRLGTMP